jgi:hypothetical protein
MAAFDTAFTPKSLAPANTTEAALFTAGTDSTNGQDVSALVMVANKGTGAIQVSVGIKPSGGSTHWLLFKGIVPANDALTPDTFGTLTLPSGAAIQVKTETANDAVFSVTGVESS